MENDPIFETIYRLNIGKELDLEYLRMAIIKLLDKPDEDSTKIQMGCLLTGLMIKKPTLEELTIVLESAFSKDKISPYNFNKEKVILPNSSKLIGHVGSGKKGIKTVNISTAASILASCGGCYIAKPGSSSVSSITGSADFISEIGINIDLSLSEMIEVIKKTGFGLFKIENYLQHFGRLYNNRWHTPHALSFGLAALANPVQVDKLVYGLTHPDVETSLRLLNRFGFDNTMVVSCSHDNLHYIDEFGIYGTTRLIGSRNNEVGPIKIFQPLEELGLPPYGPNDIKPGISLYDHVKLVIDALRGKGRTSLEDIICINTSALLYIDDKAKGLVDGYNLAKNLIHSNKVADKLKELVEITKGDQSKLKKYL